MAKSYREFIKEQESLNKKSSPAETENPKIDLDFIVRDNYLLYRINEDDSWRKLISLREMVIEEKKEKEENKGFFPIILEEDDKIKYSYDNESWYDLYDLKKIKEIYEDNLIKFREEVNENVYEEKLLRFFKKYKEMFKGPKGERGEKGDTGPEGKKGGWSFGTPAEIINSKDNQTIDGNKTFNGVLESGASRVNNVGVATSSLTLSTTIHHIVVCNNTVNITVTLPSASSQRGLTYIIKRKNTGGVTIGGTVDGMNNPTIDTRYSAVTVVSDGTDWNFI